MAYFAVLLSVIFGGVDVGHIKVAGLIEIGDVKIHPAIDKSTLQEIYEFLSEQGIEQFAENIGLVVPKYDASPLEKPKEPQKHPDDVPVMLTNRIQRRDE